MTRVLATLVLVSACGFPRVAISNKDAHSEDGSPNGDAPVDAGYCFGSGAYAVCLTALPTEPTTITSGSVLDTGTSTYCLENQPSGWIAQGQPAACFMIGTTVDISTLRVIGPRPLVIVGTDLVSITDIVDLASHHAGSAPGIGPGSPSSTCSAPVRPPIDSGSGASGGAGGSFMTRGGGGGFGDGNTGFAGGLSALADSSAPLRLRGGCPGQDGGVGTTSNSFGGHGDGGGAIYILGGSTITLGASAIINASGGGSGSSSSRGGGGGGGSGGMITIYAPTISATAGAILVANSGAGGSGGYANANIEPGGEDPDPTMPTTSAMGGVPNPAGPGSGGRGWALGITASQAGTNGQGNYAGGGGGGGAGYIQANMAITNITASPDLTIVP